MFIILKENLKRAFTLTHDLVLYIEEKSLTLDLPNLPSNQIAGQLWCMVGARESYLKAIEAGEWSGFSCSLKSPREKQSVLEALEESFRRLNDIDFTIFSESQKKYAFDLLEHEVQHHGQLIRYVFANQLTFPDSWKKRYTV
ncbi:MAG TPA: hypothetical protein VK856_15110 [Anaerolineaceae bacterium]|nr:hypothetical protein [Anaerolineaceae bacterium]